MLTQRNLLRQHSHLLRSDDLRVFVLFSMSMYVCSLAASMHAVNKSATANCHGQLPWMPPSLPVSKASLSDIMQLERGHCAACLDANLDVVQGGSSGPELTAKMAAISPNSFCKSCKASCIAAFGSHSPFV